MSNLARYTSRQLDADVFKVDYDFDHYTTAQDGLTTLATGTATVAGSDALNGVLVITSGASANQDGAVHTTQNLFVPVAGKPFYFFCRAQYAEAATNAANVFIGLASAAGANLMVSAGAGPRTTGTLMGFFKIDGGTFWNVVTRNGTTVQSTLTNVTAGGSPYFTFEVEGVDTGDTATVEMAYRINGQLVLDSTYRPILHTIPISGASLTMPTAYLKAGAGATSEVLNVDRLYADQLR